MSTVEYLMIVGLIVVPFAFMFVLMQEAITSSYSIQMTLLSLPIS